MACINAGKNWRLSRQGSKGDAVLRSVQPRRAGGVDVDKMWAGSTCLVCRTSLWACSRKYLPARLLIRI